MSERSRGFDVGTLNDLGELLIGLNERLAGLGVENPEKAIALLTHEGRQDQLAQWIADADLRISNWGDERFVVVEPAVRELSVEWLVRRANLLGYVAVPKTVMDPGWKSLAEMAKLETRAKIFVCAEEVEVAVFGWPGFRAYSEDISRLPQSGHYQPGEPMSPGAHALIMAPSKLRPVSPKSAECVCEGHSLYYLAEEQSWEEVQDLLWLRELVPELNAGREDVRLKEGIKGLPISSAVPCLVMPQWRKSGDIGLYNPSSGGYEYFAEQQALPIGSVVMACQGRYEKCMRCNGRRWDVECRFQNPRKITCKKCKGEGRILRKHFAK